MQIDKSAHVHPKAELAADVVVGPCCVIGPDVKIGPGTVLENNVTVAGHTTLGANNRIFPHAVLGEPPQDLKYRGAPTRLVVGDKNVIRECVTLNTGTELGGGVTTVGSNNFLMACSHVAHDCILGDHIIFANCVLLGGHVKVESHAKVMGLVGVNPFATVGQHVYVGGLTRIVQDVPPYMIFEGNPGKVHQVNVIGLQRAGFTDAQVAALEEAHRVIFRCKVLNRNKAIDEMERQGNLTAEVQNLIAFLRAMQRGKSGRARQPH
ncbi:MAG: acyl-ACP--UDP-N-acetylglucosamine O-acyltransferase [Planctomycetes bacterium]|nr:acyl-ACP--UDP-N-acetylglucosamine O-acyltransferase [Planctomycetota bacterium]